MRDNGNNPSIAKAIIELEEAHAELNNSLVRLLTALEEEGAFLEWQLRRWGGFTLLLPDSLAKRIWRLAGKPCLHIDRREIDRR